jgi:endonuclease VIII
VAEGDTIARAAKRIDDALAGEVVQVSAPNPRGKLAGVTKLDGHCLEAVASRGKHLLLRFEDVTLHSHLGMTGSWHLYRRGAPWRKRRGAAWIVISGEDWEAVQFGGPTLRLLSTGSIARDPLLARLGPDILSADLDLEQAVRSLRAGSDRSLGDVLLDQGRLAGIGNIFKSEACFVARLDPWARTADLTDLELERVLSAARNLMSRALTDGRAERAVYRRAGRPCRACDHTIAVAKQGDSNRSTYWCPHCQARSGG